MTLKVIDLEEEKKLEEEKIYLSIYLCIFTAFTLLHTIYYILYLDVIIQYIMYNILQYIITVQYVVSVFIKKIL